MARGIDVHTVLCPWCNNSIETLDHCLVGCEFSGSVWKSLFDWWGLKLDNSNSVNGILIFEDKSQLLEKSNKVWEAVVWIAFYTI